MKRKIRIEKAYNVVEEYDCRVNYGLEKEELEKEEIRADFTREVALVKVAVDGGKVYLQSDPIDLGDGGDLVIKRVAELDMSEAVTILYRALRETK